ncbi:hypothetical protein ALC53_03347 [Atta colombica]|uniref:Uncharacterized protein n=1 Tax=Atta colombica TaxID=520822 RepID=A0A195BN39_9HYME|nr:hypothetical protein ALC53_03347 [Atta colombica]
MFDDLRRPPDIRIFHESSMVICSRRHCTLWGTHARRHSCWVGPGSSVIMLQISKHFVKRSNREQDKVTFNDRTDVHKNEKLLKVRPITTVTRKQEKIQSVLYEVNLIILQMISCKFEQIVLTFCPKTSSHKLYPLYKIKLTNNKQLLYSNRVSSPPNRLNFVQNR